MLKTIVLLSLIFSDVYGKVQIKIFEESSKRSLENSVNSFIKNKTIKDIKYSHVILENFLSYYSAMVIFETKD